VESQGEEEEGNRMWEWVRAVRAAEMERLWHVSLERGRLL